MHDENIVLDSVFKNNLEENWVGQFKYWHNCRYIDVISMCHAIE